MDQKTIQDFIGLIKYALGNDQIKFDNVQWKKVMKLASSHHVEVIIYEAIASLPEDVKPAALSKKRIEE